MKYQIGDKFVVGGVECRVVFINAHHHAYLAPLEDEITKERHLLRCLVFNIIDEKGFDKDGNRAMYIVAQECGAV